MSTAHAEHAHGHAHPPHLAHHFDTPEQQFASGKLGMWAFLATELLMFGGLFCAYAVYRSNHPDVFLFSHHYLDAKWGGINTAVLIASSFTMAWAVRASQLGQHKLLRLLLALTFLGGVGFMCIKFIEYKSKWEHFIFPGHYNAFNQKYTGPAQSPEAARLEALNYRESHISGHGAAHGAADHSGAAAHDEKGAAHAAPEKADGHHEAAASTVATTRRSPGYRDPNAGSPDEAKIFPTFNQPVGLAPAQSEAKHVVAFGDLNALSQARVNTFFGVYFIMTGLHGVHVVVGMAIIAWLFFTAGRYNPEYYTPVDLGGLYWHLVDLIWIFLFPLLYLIH